MHDFLQGVSERTGCSVALVRQAFDKAKVRARYLGIQDGSSAFWQKVFKLTEEFAAELAPPIVPAVESDGQ